jgi:hypothetical protein
MIAAAVATKDSSTVWQLSGDPVPSKIVMLIIRPGFVQDVALLWTLIQKFAEFEHDHTKATDESLFRDRFGAKPMFRALMAEWEEEPAGYSLFFDCYASFQGPGSTPGGHFCTSSISWDWNREGIVCAGGSACSKGESFRRHVYGNGLEPPRHRVLSKAGRDIFGRLECRVHQGKRLGSIGEGGGVLKAFVFKPRNRACT